MPKDRPVLPRLIYVMGPSGAGKDAVLGYARERLDPASNVLFAHRYITRPPSAGGENHVALSDAEFAVRRAAGLFAFHWQAHDISYGIGIEIEAWRRAGFVVVVSGSREHFQTLETARQHIRGVLITAPVEILRRRLTERGRDSAASIAERLDRADTLATSDRTVTVIDNSGPLAAAGNQLVAFILGAAN